MSEVKVMPTAAEVAATIAEMEKQFAPDAEKFTTLQPLLPDVLGAELGDIIGPEDALRGLTATSCSTTHAAEEDK
ncbi:MAG TPA: hypothetical protein VLG11_01215 [Candidatus Saccharimonadales bacterium]|nr:hypothetical protein [Candidatus Saccharimonadales bacterium]